VSGDHRNSSGLEPTEQAGLLWGWWRGDPLVRLPPLDGLRIAAPAEVDVLQRLSGLDAEMLKERLRSAFQPYLAWLGSTPVAYGWSAAGRTRFGSPPIAFDVPPDNRYLFDFATLPAWRGRGIYPRLLQAILARESGTAERFWILHHRENRASARGIEKAGFGRVAEIWFLDRGGLGLVGCAPAGPPTAGAERTMAGADLLGLPSIQPI
jgi:GNAT superfamily N-acetyltransferase